MSLAATMRRLHRQGQLKHFTLIAPANGGFEANVIHADRDGRGMPRSHYSTAVKTGPAPALAAALEAHEKHVRPADDEEDLI